MTRNQYCGVQNNRMINHPAFAFLSLYLSSEMSRAPKGETIKHKLNKKYNLSRMHFLTHIHFQHMITASPFHESVLGFS